MAPDILLDLGGNMRVGVVGHVEWVAFHRIDAPLGPGAIARAEPPWEEPGGGGGVAAAELARLAGRATLFTAVGHDEIGRAIAPRLSALGVDVVASTRSEPHRRALTFVDPDGERTIVVMGPAQQPTGPEIDVSGFDAVYLCKGDAAAARAARRARVLVATARMIPVLREAGVRLDALVRSAADPSERYAPGDLDPAPALVAATEGALGGSFATADGRSGRWQAVAPPGGVVDTYGAGDSFAAALAVALARGDGPEEALVFAASRGALALTRRGAHGATIP
jgi:ribokinase